MRFIKYLFGFCLLFFVMAGIALPIGVVIYALEPAPLVVRQAELAPEDIGRVQKLMKQNDPRTLKDGAVQSVILLERDLNLLLDYGLKPYKDKLHTQVDVQNKSATILLTAKMPDNPLGAYLNVKAVLAPEKKFIAFQQISFGKLELPGWALSEAGAALSGRLGAYPEVQPFLQAVKSVQQVQMHDGQLLLTFQWSKQVAEQVKNQARDLLVSDADKERLLFYYQKIAEITYQQSGSQASLASFLKTLFGLAQTRSENGGDPVAENRALITSLTFFSMGMSPESVAGPRDSDLQIIPRKLHLTLLGRDDLPKHYLISSVIAAAADSALSNVVGVFKEVEDSKGGTGFSFPDLTADRAGVRLAELATGSPQQALALQQRMNAIQDEQGFMPRIDQLPEGLMELEFNQEFRDLDSQKYQMIEDEIQRRIDACSAFRQ